MPTRPRRFRPPWMSQGRQASDADYNRHRRDPELAAFYRSTAWRKLSEDYRSEHPLCEPCEAEGRTTLTEQVHHLQPAASHPELRLDPDNLLSVCTSCHARLEASASTAKGARP